MIDSRRRTYAFLCLLPALALAGPRAASAGNLAVSAGTEWLWIDGQPQPKEITGDPRENFLYGSVGAEGTAGIPLWIAAVLPRIFPDYLPGPGGYASLGLPWEEGKEFPAG